MHGDWTDQQIIAIRRVYRRNGSLQEAMAAIASPLSPQGFRRRCQKLGMRFHDAPSIHLGTSVLLQEERA